MATALHPRVSVGIGQRGRSSSRCATDGRAYGQLRARKAHKVIEITAVRLDGGNAHEHITDVQWRTASSTGQLSRSALVDWLNATSEHQAVVALASGYVPVLVVEPSAQAAYVRTYADGSWRNDLLGLPRFEGNGGTRS
jgi:hypothetical protein